MGIHPIILCGGPGSRLWPASTASNPKPFIDLIGGMTLFQRTVSRMAALAEVHPPIIVAGVGHVRQAMEQLYAIGVEGVVLAEPGGRDSGPALVAAALWIAERDPEGVAVAVASDHHIPDVDAFTSAVADALPAARSGRIVTFGIRPRFAASAYGYIRPGAVLPASPTLHDVAAFVEKPKPELASALIDEGCLWNSGNFMFRADAFLEDCDRYVPDVTRAVRRAMTGVSLENRVFRLGKAFLEAPKTSIDVGVMEKTSRAAVLPIDYLWSDLGAWDQVLAAATRDKRGNSVSGMAVVLDSAGSLVRAAPGAKIIAMGVENLAIVAQDGHVLVTTMDRAADLKPALSALEILSGHRGRVIGPPAEGAAFTAASRLKSWLWERALPLWWCFGADHQAGGFHEQLGQDLRPTAAARRARVQARQVWVYATAGLWGWPGPWAAAVTHGLDDLWARYQRRDGLFRAVVDPSGAVVDDTALLYDQAFVLLALASAAQALPDRRVELRVRADSLLAAIARTYRSGDGGFRADDLSDSRLANPLMHLFESALAWIDVDGAAIWTDLAREIADLFLNHLFDQGRGVVVEVFDHQWRPFPGPEGRLIEPGHQFEWAWLMERWSRLSGDRRAHDAALSLYESGERGVNAETGLVLDALLDDFSVHAATSRLWPNTERLKAALLLMESNEAHSPLQAAAWSSAASLEAYLDTPVAGLWRDTPTGSSGTTDAPAMSSSFYHIVGAICALEPTVRTDAGPTAAHLAEPEAARPEIAAF